MRLSKSVLVVATMMALLMATAAPAMAEDCWSYIQFLGMVLVEC